MRRLPFSRLIWFGPSVSVRSATAAERQDAGMEAAHVVGRERDPGERRVLVRERDRQRRERRRILADRVRQPDHHVEAAVALEDLAGRAAADRDRRRLVDVGDAEAVARQLVALHVHAQDRRAGDRLDLDVGGAGYRRRAPRRSRRAAGSSASNSSPNTFTARSPRTPARSSLKRISIGWVNS